MIVLGKEITPKTRRDVLIELLRRLTTLEPFFTDREIAAARRMTPTQVKELMRKGVIKRAHRIGATKPWTAPLSAILEWDEQTAITLAKGPHDPHV